jgi:hypothetical protein
LRSGAAGAELFYEPGKLPAQFNETPIKQLMAKHGMEYLGPPLSGLWRQQY